MTTPNRQTTSYQASNSRPKRQFDPEREEKGKINRTHEKMKKGDVWGGYTEWHKSDIDNTRRALGMNTEEQQRQMEESRRLKEQQTGENRGVLDQLTRLEDSYKAAKDQEVAKYLDEVRNLKSQAQQQATDAQQTYSNDIQPRYKGIMEDAQREAGMAMSLNEAGDPNNRIHQAVRNMYGQQAQNVGRQGLADVGVLNALGAQATAGQMGVGGPMTGSQLQLLQAGNMQQSGAAYARAQQQMERLRQQGIERGFQESNLQYERGQRAKDRYSGSVGQYEGAMDRNIGRQRGFRGEIGGYAGDMFGTQLGSYRENLGLRTGAQQRELAEIGRRHGASQESINQQIALANAQNAAQANMVGGVMGAGGTALGAYYGGPQGAKAGGDAGRSMGGGAVQAPPSQQQQGYQQQQYGVYGAQPYNYNQQPGRYGQAGYTT
jgi:hypothetical protein